ncbi:MAG: glycoside hydrolase family 3 C-terminal domain-containing protein, partial [Bacilli bacterium]|nr:glycoside hydrolase family 3 C-terminal domain-containing protein [Bacilli bacterium]
TYCTENKWLLNDLLREEWGFAGLVMTDWGATHDRVEGIKAGNDLEMPGDTAICRKWLLDAVLDGGLASEELDERVLNVLDLVSEHKKKNPLSEVSWQKHHELAKEIALESAVLLKNEGILPFKKDEKLCIIGELFEKMRYQGSGSSMINPALLTSPKGAFDQHGVSYSYAKGYRENETKPSESLIQEAVEATKDSDQVLLFLGLTDNEESEGGDRENMSLPENQLALVEALLQKGKRINVVLFGGSAIELPFFDGITSLLLMSLPGQNGGEATYELLFGLANPSGKLAQTWPLSYQDVPFGDEFGKGKQAIYKESVFVGYRYYLTAEKEVRFPFGYGLSYASYEYEGLSIEQLEEEILVRLHVKNKGNMDGKEIVQVYVQGPDSAFFKPKRELKGFAKVSLKAQEEKEVEIILRKDDLRHWNLKENRFRLEQGEYVIQVGCDAQEVVLEQSILLEGENLNEVYEAEVCEAYKKPNPEKIDLALFEKMSGRKIPELPKSKPITLESRFSELRQSFLGRILY